MPVTNSIAAGSANADIYARERAELIDEIKAQVRETKSYLGKNKLDLRVIYALETVPRHEFVPEDMRQIAYLDRALPIGHEQTISQPYIVAIMSDLLGVFKGGRVLEVGTGSGYQAAILGALGVEVYSVEIVEPLGLQAQAVLARLGFANVHVKIGDGYAGWPAQAPFDGIIVTAAAGHVPQPLIEQLKPGGRMIIPIDRGAGNQDLVLIEKDAYGGIRREEILPVRFVPLTRAAAN